MEGGLSCAAADCRVPPQKCESVGPAILFKLLYTTPPHKAGSAGERGSLPAQGSMVSKGSPTSFF